MITRGVNQEWPEELRKALDPLELGHVVSQPPLLFWGSSGTQLWTHPDGTDRGLETDGPVVLAGTDGLAYGVITTQTCDITNPAFPWVQVSPVCEVAEEDCGSADERQYLCVLNGPGFPEGHWYADLRIEVPVEKSALLGREIFPGFAKEADMLVFAERLGRRRDRAAMADRVTQVLDRTLRAAMSSKSKRKRAKRHFEEVHGIYMTVQDGTRLDPRAVGLHVVSKSGDLSDDARKFFDAWWDDAAEAGEQTTPKLIVQPLLYHDGTAMNLALFQDFIAIERRP